MKIELWRLVPRPVRTKIGTISKAELADHMCRHGQFLPVDVMRIYGWFWWFRPRRYLIINGHMRVQAAKALGWNVIECEVLKQSNFV